MQIIADVVRRPDSTYPVVFKPYKLDISQFGEKTRDEMKFTIRNVSDETITGIKIVRMPSDLIELTLPDKIEAGKTAEATLRLKKSAIDKKFESSFTIELNDRAKTRFTIPIKRNLQAPGQVSVAKPAGS